MPKIINSVTSFPDNDLRSRSSLSCISQKSFKTLLMSHISVYLGMEGCLLNTPLTNLVIKGCAEIVDWSSRQTKEFRALRVVHILLYLHPSAYNSVKNSRTDLTEAMETEIFFLTQNFCHRFQNDLYLEWVPSRQDAKIMSCVNSGSSISSSFDRKLKLPLGVVSLEGDVASFGLIVA